jgi:hypothetical protein
MHHHVAEEVDRAALPRAAQHAGDRGLEPLVLIGDRQAPQVGINYTQNTLGCLLYAWVTATNTVSWIWINNTGSSQTLPSGSVQVCVKPAYV